MRYRFAVLDTPPGLNAQQAKEWRNYVNFDSSYAAMYYPWIKIADLSGSGSTTKLVPPSGHVVGIYNREDGERGVHKAPANSIVQGAIDVEILISKGEQDVLNPIGVNCIRSFPGRGIRVWGARTTSDEPDWRYINVRRTFIMLRRSLEEGTQWSVFEPNEPRTWERLSQSVDEFLKKLWADGYFAGATPEESYFVKCDESTNPYETRQAGQMLIEVGVAPAIPTEYIIFNVVQKMSEHAVQAE